MTRSQNSATKRQREQAKRDRRAQKAEKKAHRRTEAENGGATEEFSLADVVRETAIIETPAATEQAD